MSIADTITRVTHTLSGIGQLLLLINLPLIFSGQGSISWLGIVLLIFAPNIAAMMQLGLLRAREYDADLGAAELTRDPRSLATALQKLEKLHVGVIQKIMLPGRKDPEPSLLRTHPHTHDRVERLMQMEKDLHQQSPIIVDTDHWHAGIMPDTNTGQPRWHMNGLWF